MEIIHSKKLISLIFFIFIFYSCSKSAVKNMLQGKSNKGDIAKLSDSKKIVKKSNYQEEEQKVDNTDDDVEDSTEDEKDDHNDHNYTFQNNYVENNKDKTLEKLTKELKEVNKYNQEYLKSIDKIEKEIIYIKKVYLEKSKIISNFNPIYEWEKKDIQVWAKKIRKKKIDIDKNLQEVLAVIQRAIYLNARYFPRDVQLISVLSLLYKNKNYGRLTQIYTGEGKSLIIAMLAVINVLKGYKVDIVTSSKVLAKRDAKYNSEFYSYFGITVDDNSYALLESSSSRACYKADIIYGDTLNYEADVLCDEYKCYNTRCKRPFEVVIVDEVDNMLIDERLRMTLLSTPIPGMSVITPVLETIWFTVNYIVANLPKNIEDLDPSKFVNLYMNDKKYKNSIEEFMKFCIPKYLMEYTLNQIITWVFSASEALLIYKKDEHYSIKDRKIVPIDFKRTGIWQMNTIWGNGLHQFLQMKHDLPVTQINLTTNFLSNVSFFQRYKTNIFGLTGTLGSLSEQKLLKTLYSLDTVHIPSFKIRKLKEIPGILCKNKVEWLDFIQKRIKEEASKGRAALVICETISVAYKIKKVLEMNKYDSKLINLYTEGNENEQVIFNQKLVPGQVIIATNLAGRGTDLKILKKVEENGGLYVCMTFMPENIRIEEQAFGRAGRKGESGSAQLIINKKDKNLSSAFSSCKTINEIKKKRNEKEKKSISRAMRETVKVINKDKFFKQFCKLNQLISDSTKKDKDVLAALEERWALWLLALENKQLYKKNFDEILPLFKNFENEILKDFQKKTIIKNPKYYLRQGHSLFKKRKYNEALDAYKMSSEMNELDWLPRYYLGLTNIKLKNKKESLTQITEATKLCADEKIQYDAVKLRHKEPELQRVMVNIENNNNNNNNNQNIKPLNIKKSNISNPNCKRFEKLLQIKNSNLLSLIKLKHNLENNKKIDFKFKKIEEIFDDPEFEEIINSLKVDGCTKLAVIGKKRPNFTIFCLAVLGLGEIAGGALLFIGTFGVSTPWSVGLIIEGISDIINSVVVYNKRDFDLQVYIGAKTLSLALIGAGIGGYTNFGKDLAINITKYSTWTAGSVFKPILYKGTAGKREKLKYNIKKAMEKKEVQEKLNYYNETIEAFNENTYNEEYDIYEDLCIAEIQEDLKLGFINILKYIICVPNYNKILINKYNRARNNNLKNLVNKSIEENIVSDIALTGCGKRAFSLLKNTGVIKKFHHAFKSTLEESDLNIYSQTNLVYEIMKILLPQIRNAFFSEIKKIVDDHDIEEEQKEDNENNSIIKPSYDLKEGEKDEVDNKNENNNLEIDSINENGIFDDLGLKYTKLVNQKNSILKKLKKVKKKEKIQLNAECVKISMEIFEIDKLKKKVEDFNFLVKKIDDKHKRKQIQLEINKWFSILEKENIFKKIKFEVSAKVEDINETLEDILIENDGLNSLLIRPIAHIYEALLKEKENISKAINLLLEESKSGDGSLVQYFFGKYIINIANAYSLNLKTKLKPAPLQKVTKHELF